MIQGFYNPTFRIFSKVDRFHQLATIKSTALQRK